MIRMYYNPQYHSEIIQIDQGDGVGIGIEVFYEVVENFETIKRYLNQLYLHMDRVMPSLEDHWAPEGSKPYSENPQCVGHNTVELCDHPWDAMGKFIRTKQLEENLSQDMHKLSWYEGNSESCYLYYELLKSEVSRVKKIEQLQCADGPHAGAVVQIAECDERVQVDLWDDELCRKIKHTYERCTEDSSQVLKHLKPAIHEPYTGE